MWFLSNVYVQYNSLAHLSKQTIFITQTALIWSGHQATHIAPSEVRQQPTHNAPSERNAPYENCTCNMQCSVANKLRRFSSDFHSVWTSVYTNSSCFVRRITLVSATKTLLPAHDESLRSVRHSITKWQNSAKIDLFFDRSHIWHVSRCGACCSSDKMSHHCAVPKYD